MTLRYTVSGDVTSPDDTPGHAVVRQSAVRTRAGRLARVARQHHMTGLPVATDAAHSRRSGSTM